MAGKNNSSNFVHELLWRAFEQMPGVLSPSPGDQAIDLDEAIDLPWEDQSFSTGEADPAWAYADNGFNGFQSVQEYRIHCPYRDMRFRNILRCGHEVARVMKSDSHFYLWVTKDFLLEGLVTLRMWGYTFKNMIVWLKTSRAGKPSFGMGHWYRNGWEAMLFGVKGGIGRPAEATSQPNYFLAPKPPEMVVPDKNGGWTKHSRKPDQAYQLICRNSPGPRLSLFQRGTRDGFYCWGDEAQEGLGKEWEGELVRFDDRLCFGIDSDQGDVSLLLRSEEVDELRTALAYCEDAIGPELLPELFVQVRDRIDAAGQVLEAEQVRLMEQAGDRGDSLGDSLAAELLFAGAVNFLSDLEAEEEPEPDSNCNCDDMGDSPCPEHSADDLIQDIVLSREAALPAPAEPFDDPEKLRKILEKWRGDMLPSAFEANLRVLVEKGYMTQEEWGEWTQEIPF